LRQIISVLLAVVLLPLLMKKRSASGLPCLSLEQSSDFRGGLDARSIFVAFTKVFTTPSSVKAILVVALVSIMCGLLRKYSIVDSIVDSLKKIITGQKLLMVSIPAVMGIMQVPGGAAISAPFADSIGKDLQLEPPVRSVVNLAFRHISMFVLPFSANIIITQGIVPEIDIYALIGLNLLFVAVMITAAWFLYLGNSPGGTLPAPAPGERKKALGTLLLNFSPIYMIVVFNVAFGLPLYIAVLLCIGITFFLSDRKDFPANIRRSFSSKITLMMIGIYFFRNVINSFDEMLILLNGLFAAASNTAILGAVAVFAVLFGMITGLSLVPMTLLLPLVAPLQISSNEMLLYVWFIYIWSFIGYYFSPLHLCQILSNECIGCSLGSTYREYRFFMPILMGSSFVLYSICRMIMV
jgi:hypothetical protein